MSEHLKSPASTSESEQTKQQAKMNAIRSSLQKLEEEEDAPPPKKTKEKVKKNKRKRK